MPVPLGFQRAVASLPHRAHSQAHQWVRCCWQDGNELRRWDFAFWAVHPLDRSQVRFRAETCLSGWPNILAASSPLESHSSAKSASDRAQLPKNIASPFASPGVCMHRVLRSEPGHSIRDSWIYLPSQLLTGNRIHRIARYRQNVQACLSIDSITATGVYPQSHPAGVFSPLE